MIVLIEFIFVCIGVYVVAKYGIKKVKEFISNEVDTKLGSR